MLKVPYARLGGKTSLRKVILPLIPKHKTYVEPFFGGGSIFWAKDPAERSVINDLDDSIVELLRLMKKASTDVEDYDLSVLSDLTKANQFVKTNPTNTEQKLLKAITIQSGTFGGKGKGKIYKTKNIPRWIKTLPDWQEKLKSAKIYNQSYLPLLKAYDAKDTFFFLDPPYEGSKTDKIYKHGDFNFEEFANKVKKLKGKVMITLNDSKNIRQLFKHWHIRGVVVRGESNVGAGSKDRKEVIITNYIHIKQKHPSGKRIIGKFKTDRDD